MRTKLGSNWIRIAILALIWIGFAARVWQIGAQSLWLDEALSVVFARKPVPQLISTLINQDIHPPLYYLFLHFWMILAGQSEFAVRYLSLLFGLPAVPATYVFGAALFRKAAAVQDRARVADQACEVNASIKDALGQRRDKSLLEKNPKGSTLDVGQEPTIQVRTIVSNAGTNDHANRLVSAPLALYDQPKTLPSGNEAAKLAAADRRGVWIALIGSFLLTVSPFMVYYSQEARMYSQLATFGLLSSYALWKFLTTERQTWWWAYIGFTAATVYSQYFGGLVVIFQLLYIFGLFVSRRKQAPKAFLALVITGLLYIPWLPAFYLQMQRLFHIPDFWKGQLSLSYLLEHLFAAFALGQFAELSKLLVVAVIAAILLLGGLAILLRQAIRRGGAELYLLTYFLVPLVALYAILVENPKFTERYLIVVVPAFYLAFGYALVALASAALSWKPMALRVAGVAAAIAVGLVLVWTSLTQLQQVYYGPGYRKDDNRGAVAYIKKHWQKGDIVILMMDTYQSFIYYSHGDIPWAALQPGTNVEGAAQSLNSILAGHHRAWVLLWNPDWADPTGYVRRALKNAYPQLPVNHQFTGLHLELFAIDGKPHFTVRTTPQHPDAVDFGNRLQLLGYDLPTSTIAAGQSGTITLYWKAYSALQHDYVVSLRLTDGHFYWWRHDGRPAAETYPTTYWPAGQVVSGRLTYDVPPATPPGTYYLEVGSYGQGVGSDLNVLKNGDVPDGTTAKLARITVTRPDQQPDPNKLDIPNRQNVAFGDSLQLLGAALNPTTVPPGGSVDASLWWQATRNLASNMRIELVLRNGSYSKTVVDEAPDHGQYSTDQWKDGDVVWDRHRFVVPADAPPGTSHIDVEVIPDGTDKPLVTKPAGAITVGTITVENRHVDRTPPSGIQTQTNSTLGTFAQLIGYTISSRTARPGDHVLLTLYWHATGNSGGVAYTTFSHVLNQQNLIVAQDDHPPGGTGNPTTGWVAGEYIVSHYDLTIKSDAKPGSDPIEVGMYDPRNGQRLPVHDARGAITGNRILLGSIEIR